MLQELEWDTLEKRRQAASLVFMYKIHSETIAINLADYIPNLASPNLAFFKIGCKSKFNIDLYTN